MSESFIIASAQFGVKRHADWAGFEADLRAWVQSAANTGARFLVFPEYAAMSLVSLLKDAAPGNLGAQIEGLQSLRDAYLELHRALAVEFKVYLLAGSFPWRMESGQFCNRAWLFTPQGHCDFQDKQVMTRFERETWRIGRGEPAKVFDTEFGRIGIAICYDSEFPLLVRAQIEAGAELLLVPSCTDSEAGYQRVQVAARARALEGQCHVVQSVLVGEAAWSEAIDVNVGAAGVFGPPDLGFPPDGVLALGEPNRPAWVYARLDRRRVAEVRRNGQVFNHAHWVETVDSEPVATVRFQG
ncbi:MAG: amidohydrolase [Dokdonella sp.]|nr:MAG: amidohydrolase [Gammaproteobacteria bacterium]TXI77524.1 MAG: amidohydrolase [Dokdonella sp.]